MRTDIPKLYNWTSNRPDQNSEDFKNVIAWLVAHGAPTPDVILIPLDPTGWPFPAAGTFPGSVMYLNFVGDPLPHDAAQVLNSPGVLLKELGLTLNDLNYTPPSATPTAPTPVTTHIGQALGRKGWYTQIEAATDPAKDGDLVTGLDGRIYRFVSGIAGTGWYEVVN